MPRDSSVTDKTSGFIALRLLHLTEQDTPHTLSARERNYSFPPSPELQTYFKTQLKPAAAHQTIINHHHHVFPNVAGPTFHVPVRQGGSRAQPQEVRLQRQRRRCSENGNLAHFDHFHLDYFHFDHFVFGRSWKSIIWKKTGTYPLLASTHTLFSPPSHEHMVLSALIPQRGLIGIHLLTLNTQSSASSQGGIFGSLLANRSGEEYTQRRQSWDDMKKPEGLSGFFSGLVNKPTEKK